MESWFQVLYSVLVQQLKTYEFQLKNTPLSRLKYVPLLVSNKRAQCVHPLCKPMLSKTFSQQSFCLTLAQPYPALLCPG